jgi:hypothetical protein
MCMQRNFLLFATLATAAAMPAMAQMPSAAGPFGSEAHHAAPIPDFSRVWNHPAFPWFEPPASGPGPITNLSRWPQQRPQTEGGSAAAVHLQAGSDADDTAAGSDYNVVQWGSNSPRTPEPVPSVTADPILVRGFDRPL